MRSVTVYCADLLSDLRLPTYQITVSDFKTKLKQIQSAETDCTAWTFGG